LTILATFFHAVGPTDGCG